MNKVIIFFFVALCVVPSFCDIWTNCGKAGDDFTITNVVITPDPPVKGKNLTVEVHGTFNVAVQSGDIDLTVKFSIITLLHKDEPLCGPLTEIKCPIPTGPFVKKVVELIPGDAPGGSYTGKAVITDQSKKEVACATFAVKL